MKEGLINRDEEAAQAVEGETNVNGAEEVAVAQNSEPKKESKGMNLNVTSAYLHVLGDCLMSVGVITAAIIINIWPSAVIADPLCTYFFSIIICCTTLPVLRECMLVLLEATPNDIDQEKLEEDLFNIPGIVEIHDLHIWAISVSKNSLSAHIVSETPLKTLNIVTDLLRRKYNLFHTTIQMEGPEDNNKHYFVCENDLHD